MNEENKINDDFEMIDFEEATDDEDIETLDETDNNSEEIKGTIFDNDSAQNDNKLQNQNTEGTVIDVNRLFDVHEKEEQIAEEEIKKEENKKDNRILKIQVGLIVALVLIASLVYFFGYDLLEPFIKID